MWLVDLDYNFECDCLIELSENKLSNNKLSENNLASELARQFALTVPLFSSSKVAEHNFQARSW